VNLLATPVRYWHTLRHVRPVQIFGRIWRGVYRPGPDLRAAPPRRAANALWISPAERDASLTGPAEFILLGERHRVDSAADWDDPAVELLLRYNLHYFDDLTSRGAGSRVAWHRALLMRWVKENPPGAGTGWAPYPTALRIVNWIKWSLAGNELPPECTQSLAVQARWLANRLETHHPGMHMVSNAKALVFAGLYFEGNEADTWIRTGFRLLANALREQILPDGGQFERSPMYQSLAVEDVLDVLNVSRAFARAVPVAYSAEASRLPRLLAAMRQWLATMSHPDGGIAFFNDAAFGIAPTRYQLDQYAARLGLAPTATPATGVTRLAPSGYLRVDTPPAVALLDVAPVGPDHLPAHGHADTLSFELSLSGRRMFVNSGTSRYGIGAERLRQRGTAAHNTVVVDGQDSSEVWSGFRVARRATPALGPVHDDAGLIEVTASHDGYRRLRGGNVHRRRWELRDSSLVIADRIEGPFTAAEARLHLHPEVTVEANASPSSCVLVAGSGGRVEVSVTGGRLEIQASTWHPAFGVVEPNRCLSISFDGPELTTTITWRIES
jgi:uncharacterized heparinase superfamily protein